MADEEKKKKMPRSEAVYGILLCAQNAALHVKMNGTSVREARNVIAVTVLCLEALGVTDEELTNATNRIVMEQEVVIHLKHLLGGMVPPNRKP